MKKRLNKDMILNIGFYGGLSLKAINAIIEIIGGLVMLLVSLDWINNMIRVIAIPELSEDSRDIVMNYLFCVNDTMRNPVLIAWLCEKYSTKLFKI